MRKGVIRPRQFQQPARADSGSGGGSRAYANGKDGKGSGGAPRKLALGLVAFLALVVVYFVMGGDAGDDDAMTAAQQAVRPGGAGPAAVMDPEDADIVHGAFRGGLANNEDDEDEDEDDEGEETDDEDTQEHDDEDEATNTDDEDDEDTEDSAVEDEDSEDEDAPLAAGNAFDDIPDLEQQRSAEIAEEDAARAKLGQEQLPAFTGPDDKRLTIDAYFSNLNKKTVNISPSGSFKFVLVHAKDKNGDGAYIVQGCSHRSKTCKHPDAARTVRHSLAKYGLSGTVLGGGRITRHHLKHSERAGLISIFGYSRTYGHCDDCNKKVCDFVAAAYPEYLVRYSNQGYLESDESRIKSSFIKCS
ncbi:Sex-regulated protein janus-A [Hondaea fermentalgiana]|uniref:Sex-regulated protein janus-A n=1 Tax=Hondaea fermentalgiana TaxID=2315210 RepID=A0A2R5GNN2_9STRA|nr:Sex-regulated protein janus-A [Hondaea fermentalgiana]|eukprot:GBG31909.1 Sex-regulated protein janus-A [Hondaea fermentalgiana]